VPVGVIRPAATHQASVTPPPEDRDRQFVHRVRSEYLEWPALCLTFDQARCLWALDSTTCERVLQDLIAEGFLAVSARGHYVRAPTT